MAQLYERSFQYGVDHEYPNVNTVRVEAAFLSDKRGGNLLDYGFGYTQEVLHFLKKGYKVSGLDISPTAVKRGYQRIKEFGFEANLAVVDPNWDRLPYKDNTFDVIHSNQCIYFLADFGKINALLGEFKRILKPDGKILISAAGRENTICATGEKIGENIYSIKTKFGESNKCYIFPDEAALRKSFSIFDIVEIGSFNNVYCGTNGFHWLVLAKNKK
jgi:SAM-dependent methyltransferase